MGLENNVTQDDLVFLEEFFLDELTVSRLEELDVRLKRKEFRQLYDHKLKEKYKRSFAQKVAKYLPLIILIALVIIGVYLFKKSN